MDIIIKNARLSFPSLFKPSAFDDSQEPKYSATFLLDKKSQKEMIDQVNAAVEKVAKEKFQGKLPAGLKTCFRDGNERDHVGGYAESMFINASSKRRPPVVDKDKSPLVEEDGKPYAGCFVNAVVRLWAQDNKWGKRVNASLEAVQFAKDGEAFGIAPVDASSVFDEVPDFDGV